MDIKKRIIYALEKSGKTRQSLADRLDLGRAAVSDMLNKEGEFDSLKYIVATAELTGFSFQWLCTGTGPEKEHSGVGVSRVEEPSLEYLSEKLKMKDELIVELRGKIADMKKYQELLEKQLKEKAK